MAKLLEQLIVKLQNCEELKECDIDSIFYIGESAESNNPLYAVRLRKSLLGSVLTRLEFLGFKLRYINPIAHVDDHLGLVLGLEYVGHNVR